jgi:hypothetical protein
MVLKTFRRQRPRAFRSSYPKFFRAIVEVNDASSAAPLGPLLGQLQVPLLEFCNSFNEYSLEHYNESFDSRVQLTKVDLKYNYLVKFPLVSFAIYQFYLDYGLEFDDFIYSSYEVKYIDFWYIIQLCCSLNNVSSVQMTETLFGYFYTSIIRRISF